MFNYLGKRKLGEEQHNSLTSNKRLKLSIDAIESERTASTTHQTLSSPDTGMCMHVKANAYNWKCFTNNGIVVCNTKIETFVSY